MMTFIFQRTDAQKNSRQFVFHNNKTPKWSNTGKRRRKLTANKDKCMNLIQNHANIVNCFSRFFISPLKKSIKSYHFVIERWQFDRWNLNLRARKNRNFMCVLLLMIKNSQSACKKLACYCKMSYIIDYLYHPFCHIFHLIVINLYPSFDHKELS